MRILKIAGIFICLLIIGLLFHNCSVETKKKIVYINSYHAGHPSSDEIMEGFVRNMPSDSFHVHSFYMDTKRNHSKEFIEKRASELLDSIRIINPDILLVSDDNAVTYIVEPNLKKLLMPIIFCGVNWTDKEYNLPKNQVIGIIEILPVADALKSIKKYYPTMEKLLVLNENTTTSRKEKQILDTLFQGLGFSATYKLVDDFEEWKKSFQNGNQIYDIIYISTHAAIKGWNKTEAVDFINNNIKVPVFTCEDFMMPYAVFGVTKIAEEHGIWAASSAKKILSGVAPENIPVTKNKLSNTWLNARLAEKIQFYPDSTFMKNARIVGK
jgi:ABC-type uncharacterized transport system substrate-binding protein